MLERPEDELRAEILRLQAQIRSGVGGPLDDRTASKRRTDARRLTLLEAVAETVPVGIVLADASGKVVHGNSYVEQLVGHPVILSEGVDDYGAWTSFHPDGR